MNAITAIRSYFIRSNPWAFHTSPERIEYHIKHGDCLPLLATIMGFMKEVVRNKDSHAANQQKTEIALKLARDLRTDLCYVSARYTLESGKD